MEIFFLNFSENIFTSMAYYFIYILKSSANIPFERHFIHVYSFCAEGVLKDSLGLTTNHKGQKSCRTAVQG